MTRREARRIALADIYPGTGAVSRAWQTWRGLFVLPDPAQEELIA